MSRLRRFWATVRPRTRRGAVLASISVLAGAGLLSVALLVGAAMAWSPYLTFALDRDSDASTWTALEPSFTGTELCVTCHKLQAQEAAVASHAGIGCESCHGALEEHALAAEDPAAKPVAVTVPGNDLCVRCHVAAVGRPTSLRQVVPEEHYVPVCLECHDPHTGIANRPPVVEHPLDHLPTCLTCHGPEGFKARNQRHPDGTTDDAICLECHAAGRGPDDDQVPE